MAETRSFDPFSKVMSPGNAAARNLDPSPFHNKDSKIIHYHGRSDDSIATGSSIY